MKVKYAVSEIKLTKEEAKACEEAKKIFDEIAKAMEIKGEFSQFGEDCATAYNIVDDILNNWVDDIEIIIED